MPLCEGHATGPGHVQPCPDARNDSTVRGWQGDLFLCDACTEFRFPSASVSSISEVPLTKSSNCHSPFECSKTDSAASVHYSTEVDVDEVLCFLKSAFIKGTVDSLKSIAVSFYTADELSVAKAKLQKTAENVGIDGLRRVKKRAGPNKAKAEADDIITILQLPDEQKLFNRLPLYVAANIDRLPTTPVESMDVVILSTKLHLLEQRLNDKCEQLETRLQLLESHHPTLQLDSGSAAADQYTSVKHEEFETRLSQMEASLLSSQLSSAPSVVVSEFGQLMTQRSHPESQLGPSTDSLASGVTTVDRSSVNQENVAPHPVQPSYADHVAAKTANTKDTWFKVVRQRHKKVVGNAGSTDLKPASTVLASKAVSR